MFRKIRSWFIQDRATVAVEYSLVAIPFFMILIGIIEVSLFFATGVLLEGAANDAARTIRTGQVQGSVDPVKAFEDQLCAQVALMIQCGDLQSEVQVVPGNNFSSVSSIEPTFDEDGKLVPVPFSAGGANDIILVRVVYYYQFLTPFMGKILAQDSGTNLSLLMSTVVVKNEPYTF